MEGLIFGMLQKLQLPAMRKIPTLLLGVVETLLFDGADFGFGWTTSDNPLSYSFYYRVQLKNLAKINSLSDESDTWQLWYYGDRYTSASKLPLGNANDDFKLRLYADVCNKYQCCNQFFLEAKVRVTLMKYIVVVLLLLRKQLL